MVRLKSLDGPHHVDFKVRQKLVFLQSPKRLQLDGAWAVHQPVELLGESGQIAGMRHRVEHQTLVPFVGAAVPSSEKAIPNSQTDYCPVLDVINGGETAYSQWAGAGAGGQAVDSGKTGVQFVRGNP